MSENHIPKNSDITYGRSLCATESVKQIGPTKTAPLLVSPIEMKVL